MLSSNEKLKWISSLGGPLILMERNALSDWHGSEDERDYAKNNHLTDYDRAGEISDYLGVIEVSDSKALVLPMPNETTSVPIDPEHVLIARWIWAESEGDVRETLQKLELEQPWVDSGVMLNFDSGDLILFDSVYSGRDVFDSINISVKPGTYSVSTLSYQPNNATNLFMIELQRTTVV